MLVMPGELASFSLVTPFPRLLIRFVNHAFQVSGGGAQAFNSGAVFDDASSVPEPNTLAILGLGLAG